MGERVSSCKEYVEGDEEWEGGERVSERVSGGLSVSVWVLLPGGVLE